MQSLVYIKPYIEDKENNSYEYEFFFSETPDIVWGGHWDEDNPSTAGDLTPEESTYNSIKRVKTKLPLKVIQRTSCYPMEYILNGSLALAWIDIDNLEEYPEHGRMVFHFGDTEDKVKELLGNYQYVLI